MSSFHAKWDNFELLFLNKIYDYKIKFNIRKVSMSKLNLTIVMLFVLTACDIPFIPGI